MARASLTPSSLPESSAGAGKAVSPFLFLCDSSPFLSVFYATGHEVVIPDYQQDFTDKCLEVHASGCACEGVCGQGQPAYTHSGAGGEDGIIEGREEVSWHRFLPSSYHEVSCPNANLLKPSAQAKSFLSVVCLGICHSHEV